MPYREELIVSAGVSAVFAGFLGSGAWCVLAAAVGVLATYLIKSYPLNRIIEEGIHDSILAAVVALTTWITLEILIHILLGIALLLPLIISGLLVYYTY